MKRTTLNSVGTIQVRVTRIVLQSLLFTILLVPSWVGNPAEEGKEKIGNYSSDGQCNCPMTQLSVVVYPTVPPSVAFVLPVDAR